MFSLKPLIITGFTAIALSSTFSAATSLATPPVKVTYATQAVDAHSIASGTFSGRTDHITTGSVSIVKNETGYQLVFADNFSLDGAPDPIVGFGNNGQFELDTKLGALTKKTGRQTYQLPADFSPAQFSEVYVYCEKFSVPLGVATLN